VDRPCGEVLRGERWKDAAAHALSGPPGLSVIKGLATEGITMIIVTHEMKLAFSISDRVVFMQHGQIALEGAPAALLSDKANSRLEKFLDGLSLSDLEQKPL